MQGDRRSEKRQTEAAIQQKYYAETAAQYDDAHVVEDDEHHLALRHIEALLPMIGIESMLDVGTGTGRALRYFREAQPDLRIEGVEPVEELIDRAVRDHGLPSEILKLGSGYDLPYADSSLDAVCELGVLHHVADPARVVREMTRVARRAVFLSDTNRFGAGSPAARWAKLGLAKLGAWPFIDRVKTRGKGYRLSEGDGLSYSYSVYDSVPELTAWANRVFFIPTDPEHRTRAWLRPLLTSAHILVCAVR
jgi:ubiquinone/menaquinone biosynthesis C-methylase UbiE